MMWTSEHDVLLCREILLVEPYNHKPSTRERGHSWDTIAADLNNITEVTCNVTKRSVRDRFNLLIERFTKQERENARATGVDIEEEEIDQLLRELVEKSEQANMYHEQGMKERKASVENDKAAAVDQRNKAMESLGETKKRKELLDDESPQRKNRKTGTDTLAYLREKGEIDQELRREEIRSRNEETRVFREALMKNNSSGLSNLSKQVKEQQDQQQLILLQQQRIIEQQVNFEHMFRAAFLNKQK